MLPTGKSVTSRLTHRRWTGGTALLSQRYSFSTKQSSRLDTFDSSALPLLLYRRYPAAFCGYNRANNTIYLVSLTISLYLSINFTLILSQSYLLSAFLRELSPIFLRSVGLSDKDLISSDIWSILLTIIASTLS